MFTKFFAGSILALSSLAFATVGVTDKPQDCCSAKLACCKDQSACCQTTAKLGCCEKGMKCCNENKGCCSATPKSTGVQQCCVEGKDCCNESKACCNPENAGTTALASSADCCHSHCADSL